MFKLYSNIIENNRLCYNLVHFPVIQYLNLFKLPSFFLRLMRMYIEPILKIKDST